MRPGCGSMGASRGCTRPAPPPCRCSPRTPVAGRPRWTTPGCSRTSRQVRQVPPATAAPHSHHRPAPLPGPSRPAAARATGICAAALDPRVPAALLTSLGDLPLAGRPGRTAPLSPGCTPRMHDLRHTLSVTTLLGWYRAGSACAPCYRACRPSSATPIPSTPTGTCPPLRNCSRWRPIDLPPTRRASVDHSRRPGPVERQAGCWRTLPPRPRPHLSPHRRRGPRRQSRPLRRWQPAGAGRAAASGSRRHRPRAGRRAPRRPGHRARRAARRGGDAPRRHRPWCTARAPRTAVGDHQHRQTGIV